MTRVIIIVLTAAIALQAVGCSTWQPLVRVNEGSDANGKSSMREQLPWNLKEGMRVKIRIRAGTPVPIRGRVIEGNIKTVGPTSVTVIPTTIYGPITSVGDVTLHYSAIVSIELRESSDGSEGFWVGLAAGMILSYYLVRLAFLGI